MSWFKIFSAVLVANLVTFTLLALLGLFVMGEVVDSLGDVRDSLYSRSSVSTTSMPSAEDLKARQAAQEVKLKEQQLARVKANRESARKQRINAQHKEMCDFWSAEFRKYGDGESEAYRDLACRRYRESVVR